MTQISWKKKQRKYLVALLSKFQLKNEAKYDVLRRFVRNETNLDNNKKL